ncbi:DNA-directed RNA polymerase III subunit RPC8 isoform X1 [Canis lupus baileyi]|uniref:DNA-directed RNA polymerase subunit n=1 Tax=Canis lupus familiaris TaxID=9615 RepID=A0A8C0SY15_CANLF|nr:DNA-directed RNA polymerase III subunit RPC8 isoform X2 [Canis lupus familiaris]XP_025314370.1 DNA-directed RNA polymerase III subunit RPC8 isoform X2 [Canis lupus dingo]XP_038406353.1 DNA-directed RNA polymerase III subunit RPC8 isoform X2 [Canis lupus familiaris]XP_038535661.1 DNA-directed RNA polymerase III subunit RPC8 isoform X2 [Canis lupus familiaris]|eukprot:XP_005625884.1 DNA-directed RNA polymerase III subunit RPC8 isoform X2 [Canis lupus familiaris]
MTRSSQGGRGYHLPPLLSSGILPGGAAQQQPGRSRGRRALLALGSVGGVVHFRYVVFHPFLDEILIGRIKGCSPEGVHVSLGFFDDILIPPESLQQPAKFDEAEQVWVWEYETEEGAHDLYMDTGEEIRFRVVDESFVDTSPTGPSSAEATSSSEELPKKEAPYTLVGSISEPGLGLLSWWTSS